MRVGTNREQELGVLRSVYKNLSESGATPKRAVCCKIESKTKEGLENTAVINNSKTGLSVWSCNRHRIIGARKQLGSDSLARPSIMFLRRIYEDAFAQQSLNLLLNAESMVGNKVASLQLRPS